MNTMRSLLMAFVLAPMVILPTACVVTPVDGYENPYGRDVRQQFDMDYFESFGFDYGTWGPGYRIGPPGRGQRNGNDGRTSPPEHTYRAAPPARAVPGIPTGGRSGHHSEGARHER